MIRNHPAPDPAERPVLWVGSAKRDLLDFPAPVVHRIGMALAFAQFGAKHPSAKPWRGAGPGVFEIVQDFAGNTYRGVYTVRFPKAICVLHCFQKKSPHGISTARPDIQLILSRLRVAQTEYGKRHGPVET
jgi:phage-related protein